MKKILSALISVIMLFCTVSAVPVMADGVSGNYTFVDTCYSPQLGLYVAIAKDLDASTTPMQIFVSENGHDWKKRERDITPAKHYGNPGTRQTIVWWEAEGKFVLQANNQVYLSENGIDWTVSPNESMTGSNTTVETNGKQLVLAAGATVKVFNSLEDTPPISSDSTAFKLVDKDAIAKTIGITPDEPMRYIVGDQYKVWYFDAEGNKSTITSNISAHPYDMTYVDGFNGWVLINGTDTVRVLENSDTTRYNNFTSMRLSDETYNTEKFTSVGVNEDNVVLGTNGGNMLIAPNDSSSLTVDVPWIIAKPGNGSESLEEIRSISAVNDGMFLVAGKTKLFMLINEADGWYYYDTAKDDIMLEKTRFEIPVSGMYTELIEPVHYNYKGGISEDEIVSFELISDLPTGVQSDAVNNSCVQLLIDSSAAGGHEIKYHAETAGGKTKDFIITIVDEDHIELKGNDRMAIPLPGEAAERYEYSAEVIGTDGMKMSRDTEITVLSQPDGIEFDNITNNFTVDENAGAGEILIKAASKAKPENFTEKTVNVSIRAPYRMEFIEAPDSQFIPNTGIQTFAYSAKLYDQIDKEMPGVKINWSIEPKDIESMDGISIDRDTGGLLVDSTSLLGVIVITAADGQSGEVTASKDVTLNYTDLRMAQEDLSEFQIDASVPVTESINLITKGRFESVITWRSSDENIIKTDGTVIRPSREDKKITIKGRAKKNEALTEVQYELLVKKADNLCVNGDLSDGTVNGWQPKGGSVLAVEKDGEKNVLKVKGGGAYQTLTLTNDSSYGFNARVKAASGSKIKLVSEKGGTLAEITASGGYQDIKASYDYRKQKNSFEDKIYLECNGELRIEKLAVYEITLELNAVASAVNKAEYSKTSTDINAANMLLAKFYDLPIRDELYKKLNSINSGTTTGGSTSGGSGGGGGGGGGIKKEQTPSELNIDNSVNMIPIQTTQDDNTADELDTYLLRFKDMKNHWARADVEYMAELGIVNGDENDIFRPDDNVSRAEFATMITRAMELEETPYENSFFDVVSEDWYSGYVQTVRSNDYMSGYDGLFKPNEKITREEIARVIVAAYNSKTNTKLQTGRTLYFNDIDDISYWAYDYIVEAADMGFIYGITDELFAPRQSATRAQAAAMLKRVYEKLHPAE